MSLDFSQEYEAPIVTTSLTPQDDGEVSLRPRTLADYTGQEKAKGNLAVYIEAARRRSEPLDHVLLYGPPGLGKTTLAGVIGLTKSVARELAPKGITCNAVAPGFVATDMTAALPLTDEQIRAAVPLGRMAKPEEIADAVAFLLQSDYITGQVLCVDGGVAI